MICEPVQSCDDGVRPLVGDTPPPGLDLLRRRLGHYQAFVDDLVRRCEQRTLPDVDGGTAGPIIGRRWDIEGDPAAMALVELWGYVAEGVAAYSELTAGEAYLPTARDWLDLARLADHVGYRPGQRVAAEGWVRFDTDNLAGPLIPAGTKVQASGTPERSAQTFEVIADTQLQPDWAHLTATWVPEQFEPTGRTIRFLGDPGFRAGDDVLLISEAATDTGPIGTDWLTYWLWLLRLYGLLPSGSVTPKAVLRVVGHSKELGTTMVEFDRDLDGLVDLNVPHAAYRITDKASTARRLDKIVRIPATGTVAESVNLPAYSDTALSTQSVILDRELPGLSTNSLVAVVRWDSTDCLGDVLSVVNHVPVEWAVATGATVLASKLVFDSTPGVLAGAAGQRDVYVLDRRVPVAHYEFPTGPPSSGGTGLQIRVWPAPTTSEPPSGRLAVKTEQNGLPVWELLEVGGGQIEQTPDGVTDGLILDIVGGAPEGSLHLSPASGNVVKVRHGVTTNVRLKPGDGVTPNRSIILPDAPVAAVTGVDGTATDSLSLQVGGRLWTERDTLFAAGAVEGYETRLGPDGELEVLFGDRADGVIPGGAESIEATYRVGGGTEGEVGPGEIDTLLGSIRGVRAVEGAGSTANGADQPTERDLRRQAPSRARAMGRVVALGDAADLALAFPGVSHSVAWMGAPPPGTAAGPGAVVAVLRRGSGGIRAALDSELQALSSHLDSRRDVTIPMSVVSAELVTVTVTVTVTGDPVFSTSTIEARLIEALTDPGGVLAAQNRALGQPLDRSDVIAVIHGVEGVIGITSLGMTTPTVDATTSDLGRVPAEVYQLLVTDIAGVQVVFP